MAVSTPSRALGGRLTARASQPPLSAPAQRLTVSVEGFMPVTEFDTIAGARLVLWATLRQLPLGYDQATAFHELLVDRRGERLEQLLAHRPGTELTFVLEGQPHRVRIARA